MKKSELKQIIKEEINNVLNEMKLNEKLLVYPGKFLPELEKFLKLQIKKGAIKGIDIDEVDNFALQVYKKITEINI
jgi:hypothetical protein